MYVGLLWLLLTAVFETLVLNRLVGEMSWRDILATYDVVGGHFWPFVLLWIGLLPCLLQAIGNGCASSHQG